MYDWNDLRYFLELSRQGKLVKAALRLQVDHTTVSRRIASLEKQLQARLFDKSPTGYQLTDAGMRLLPMAEKIESQSNNLYQALSGKDARLSGTVRISTSEGIGAQVIARHIGEFRGEHPDIEIELMADTRRTSLSKREADIAITFSRPESGRLKGWKLCDYRLKLYGSLAYLDNHPKIETIEDLAQHSFVSYIDDLIEIPELRYFESTFKNPHVVFRSTNLNAQYNAIRSGVGLGLVHCFMTANDPQLVAVLPGQIMVQRSFWLMVHEDLRDVARVDAVCRFITKLLRDNEALMMG
jgi:DNA-binding transcriptional LysR family regulator